MSVSSLGYVVIETTDLAAWRRFAEEVVGLMPAPSGDDEVALYRMDDRPFRFWIQRGQRERFVGAGWEYASEADHSAALDRLRNAGCMVELAGADKARARRVYQLARSSDPAGHGLELYYGRLLDYAPFVSPAGVSGFVTGSSGGMGLGHVVLSAPSFEPVHAFYKQVLGFGDTDLGRFYLAGGGADDPGVAFAFMHARNGRHHSVALGELPHSPSGAVHLMVEVATLEDVGRAYDRARRHKVPISATLGKHVNDKMTSFYMRTPGGFDLEYGWNGLVIDPATWVPTTSVSVSDWGHVWAHQGSE